MNTKTKNMVGVALFIAIVVVLQMLGGGIKVGGMFSISLVLIPIVVGAALYGWKAGGILGFKPILTLKDGELKLMGKGRGVKQSMKLMIGMLEKEKSKQLCQPYYFGYTHVESTCDILRAEAKDKLGAKEEIISPVGCAIGTHVGPGAAVIAYLTE